jgi:Phytanoyl-CoA dioxygenase (PhyH)/SCP-2 sterol transfer family
MSTTQGEKRTEADVVVVNSIQVADFKRQAASAAEVTEAVALLRGYVARVRGDSWKVCVYLDDKTAYYIDCGASEIRLCNELEPEVDGSIWIHATDLLRIGRGEIDPRFLIFYQRLKMSGSVKVVTKFLDGISGRSIVGVYKSTKALPVPTVDFALAKAHFREFGYCFIKDALSPAHVSTLRRRLEEQAAAEREIGYACRGSPFKTGVPPIQPIWNLVNKGQVFLDLFDHPIIDAFCPEFLGEYFLISSYTSKIAHPGCQPQPIHTDQIMVNPAIPGVNVGLNIFFYLDNFTDEIGATRIVPGSHLPQNGVAPDNILSIEGTIAAEAPAGTALLFDTRLWHGTGPNRTKVDRRAIFMLMVRSWMRTVENHTLSVRPEVLAKMSDRVKIMHGFRTTASAGGVDGAIEGEIVNRDFEQRMGELHPKQPLGEF